MTKWGVVWADSASVGLAWPQLCWVDVPVPWDKLLILILGLLLVFWSMSLEEAWAWLAVMEV